MTSGTAALCRILEETNVVRVIEKRRPIKQKKPGVYVPPWRRLIRKFYRNNLKSSQKDSKSSQKDKSAHGGSLHGLSAHGGSLHGGSFHGGSTKSNSSSKNGWNNFILELDEDIDSDDEEAVARRDKVPSHCPINPHRCTSQAVFSMDYSHTHALLLIYLFRTLFDLFLSHCLD